MQNHPLITEFKHSNNYKYIQIQKSQMLGLSCYLKELFVTFQFPKLSKAYPNWFHNQKRGKSNPQKL